MDQDINKILEISSPSNDTEKHHDKADKGVVSGMGGWLILPAIGLVASLLSVFSIIGSSVPGGYGILSGGLWLLTCVAVVSFFMKKRLAPRLIIIVLIVRVLIPLPFTDHLNESHGAAWAASILAAIIWIPYFVKSRRVKATFCK